MCLASFCLLVSSFRSDAVYPVRAMLCESLYLCSTLPHSLTLPSLLLLCNKQRTRVLLDDAAWAIPTDESETHKERDREIRNWIEERTERIAKGRQEGRKEPRRQKGERNSETGILRKAWRLRMKGCPIRPQVVALYKRFLHFREKAQIWQHELLSSQFLL